MGFREILLRSIFKRLNGDVGKPEIRAGRIGQLTDGRVNKILFKENYSLLYNLFQLKWGQCQFRKESETEKKRIFYLSSDIKINLKFQTMPLSAVLYL